MNELKDEADWNTFKIKWKDKVTILENSIEPMMLMYSKNILCNQDRIIKINGEYQKHFDDFYASTNDLNNLVNITNNDKNSKFSDVVIFEIKNSRNSAKESFRSLNGSLSCAYVINPPSCNKRRVLGQMDWATGFSGGLFIFEAQATSKFQYTQIVWVNRDADTIFANTSHKIIDDFQGQLYIQGSDKRYNSKLAIAYATWVTPVAFSASEHDADYRAMRNECSGIDISCSNYQAN